MDLKEIYKARRRIRGWVRNTPIEYSPFLSDMCGGRLFLKLENLQLTGSFKIRGAMNKLLHLSEDEKRRGIITASSGNHAQGVSYAARELGIVATIVVPRNTPEMKLEAIRRHGVELIIHGDEYIDAEKLARKMELERGMTFVSAYNDLEVIAGQGTVAVEVMEEFPDLDTILVPVGGGGLISGVSIFLKGASKSIEVLGVQSEASPVMHESLRGGRIVDMKLGGSVAEGLHGGIEQGSITFDFCRDLVDEIILVKEDTIMEAIWIMFAKQRQVVEGAGAVGVAAVMEDPSKFIDKNTCVIISGGNLDENLLRTVIKMTDRTSI